MANSPRFRAKEGAGAAGRGVVSISRKKSSERYWRRRREKVTPRQAIAVWVRDGGKCFWCKKELLPEEVEIDHHMPVALGGNSHIDNLTLVCKPCNSSKRDLHPRRYALRIQAGRCLGDRWYAEECRRKCELKPPMFDLGCEDGRCRDTECPSFGGAG